MGGQKQESKVKLFIQEIGLDFIASIFLAVGLNVFSVPNHIVAGGVTGVATLINYFTDIPIGTMAFCLNIPLLLIGFRYIGKRFFFDTIKVLFISAFCIDYLTTGLPVYTGNALLGAVFGGVCIGIGLGLVIMRGSSTGGVDIIINIIRMKHPHLSFGTIMIVMDFMVVIAAGIIFQDFEAVMYALILIYITGEIINKILRGLDMRKMVIVITQNAKQVSHAIITELSRGATVLPAKGAYSGADTNMIVCAVSNQEFVKFKRILKKIDPTAFIMVSEVGEILGEGFKSIHQDL